MADWDADSPQLRTNLARLGASIQRGTSKRETPSRETARKWHRKMMAGLTAPRAAYVGRYRGEVGLENARVFIGTSEGSPPGVINHELAEFERKLQAVVAALDRRYPVGEDIDIDGVAAVTDLAGWAHAEWVRIHPFANGNGRTARLWANFILVRYGLPPVVRLRPRPRGDYQAVCVMAMEKRWLATANFIRRLLSQLNLT